MEINRKLNLVVPIERESGEVYVHSMPIGRQVFERYFLVISKAFASIFQEGLNFYSGPRIAAMMIRQVATEGGTLSPQAAPTRRFATGTADSGGRS